MSKDLHNDEEITIDLLEIANILKRNAGNIARLYGILFANVRCTPDDNVYDKRYRSFDR